jgi:hypothetical protein
VRARGLKQFNYGTLRPVLVHLRCLSAYGFNPFSTSANELDGLLPWISDEEIELVGNPELETSLCAAVAPRKRLGGK